MNMIYQVRFALSTAEVFIWNNPDDDPLGFYNGLMNFLEDPEEEEEVGNLLRFWNQYVLATPGLVQRA